MSTNDKMIEDALAALFRALPYRFEESEEGQKVMRAFQFAEKAHRGVNRVCGVPYILHPLAVATVLAKELRQKDADLLCAALLHDVVEDTEYTLDDIRQLFGNAVAWLVSSVTKLGKVPLENIRAILKCAVKDIRVIILKLADRLDNLRTIGCLKEEKRYRICAETLSCYAPIAGALGLSKIKSELENTSFSYLDPEMYAYLEKAIAEDWARNEEAVKSFMYGCLDALKEEFGGSVGMDIRVRKPYSVYRDMVACSCDFAHLPHKHYVRAVFDPEDVEAERGKILSETAIALGIYAVLTERYKEQGGFVNYINQPKPENNYRGIHFRVLNPMGGIEEIHVASENMRVQSIFGCLVRNEDRECWVRRLTDILKELTEDASSLVPDIHDVMYHEGIVAFTPEGDPVNLPQGASALDFAFGVHTELGERMKCARINGQLSSRRTVLRRGDRVEVFTEPQVRPEAEWLDYAVSFKAKKAILRSLELRPAPSFVRCPHCHPLPGTPEVIGVKGADGRVTVHARNCPDAIRAATEDARSVVSVKDFLPDNAVLYPVSLSITAVDRFRLLHDIIDSIVETCQLSMTALSTTTGDEIVDCQVSFAVHSEQELVAAMDGIRATDGVEEVRVVHCG